MFEQEHIDNVLEFFSTYPRYAEIERFRTLRGAVGHIDNVFYGDSLTASWPLHEFFPHYEIVNRGIGGDSVYGLYHRMEDDVFAYTPKRVFMMVGINGIQESEERITSHIFALSNMLLDKGISVGLSSILPLREGDNWDRFQYMDKILRINEALRKAADDIEDDSVFYLDYHSEVKDETGQLAAECAKEDGTHITFEAYCRMAKVVEPYLIK